MRETDRAPGKDGRQPGDGQHPVESFALFRGGREVAEKTDECGEGDTDHGTTATIDVGEDAGSLALLGEGGEGTRGAVDGRVTDGEDGDHDNDVHDGWEDGNAGIVNGDDEGRGGSISAGGATKKTGLVVWDEETDEGERDDVEEGDTPENLLNGCREGLARVCGLGGGKTDELGTSEGEGRGHEDAAETLEAVVECARV